MKGWENANMYGKEIITRELLEACITALGYITRTSTSISYGGKPPEIINLLRAAIARAGGSEL